MDRMNQDRELIERVLCETARRYASGDTRTLTAFDRNTDQYLVFEEGWEGYKRLHYTFVHVELRDGKFWIQKDNTEYGVAADLIDAGIPNERIVLAFQHEQRRKWGEFAAA
jgi:hypothetical protein